MTANTTDDGNALAPTIDRDELDADRGARGTLYALLARAFVHPDEELYDALATGEFAASVASLLDRTALDVDGFADGDDSGRDGADGGGTDGDGDTPTSDRGALRTDDDYETLCARYNDLFVVSFTKVEDRTDGTETSTSPPVPLYESSYRSDVSWTDVNLDLMRAYDFYGLEVDQSNRDHHDRLQYQLEFAGYLARRAAVTDDGAPAARLDLLDRHLRVITEGIADSMADEPETGVYGPLVRALDAFTAADRRDLIERVEGE